MTDVLKPDLLWIEGRCYRINEAVTTFNFEEDDLYSYEMPYNEEGDGDGDDYEIIPLDNGKLMTSFHVPQHYFGVIIGKKGMMKTKIEGDTKTEIKIPKHGQSGDITVTGSSAVDVKTARRRIEMIIVSARARERPTHFVSIPVNCDNIKDNFNKLKELVLSDSLNNRIEEDMFILATKLHFTICVMSLMDNEERQHASQLMAEAQTLVMSLLKGEPLRIKIKGMSYMEEDPKEVNVLYGTPDPAHPDTVRLQSVADAINKFFLDKGVAKCDRQHRDNVKLHMTLVNNKYSTKQQVRAKRQSFDVTAILEKYADYDFGEVVLSDIHLSQMHSLSPEGYYSATCVVSCKESG